VDQTWSKLMNAVVREGHVKNMKGSAAVVYMVLLTHSDFELKDCFPGIARICELSGLKEFAVRKALSNLEEIGLITKTKRANRKKGNLTNLYSFEKFTVLEGGCVCKGGGDCICIPGQGCKTNEGGATKTDPNNTHITTPKTTTLKRRIIQEEYETTNNLSDDVVAILKALGVGESVWSHVESMDISRIQAIANLSKKKDDPGAYFAEFIRNGYSVPGLDQSTWEIVCERVRARCDKLRSKKTGKEFLINKYQTGPVVVLDTPKGEHRIANEQELLKFTEVQK